MEWKKERKIRKRILWGIIIALLFIKIPIFLFKSTDLHSETASAIIENDRSIWYYNPLCDSLLIVDSLRNIRFKVIDAYAYNARYFRYAYFQFFMPWAEIKNLETLFFWNVNFEAMDIRGKISNVRGIFICIGDSTNNASTLRSMHWWDNIEKNTSHFGARVGSPLPDTLYFTVWGYRNLYYDKRTYRTLSENDRIKAIQTKEPSIVLGEIVFVKADSIIYPKKPEEFERKLFFKDIYLL